MTVRAAFVTIGQTPRIDMVPEMRSEIEAGLPAGLLEINEYGVLDGKAGAELAAYTARPGHQSFATRLASGQEMAVDVEMIEAELNRLLQRLDGIYELVVLLCTGTRIDPLQHTLVIEAQRLVDSTFEAIGASAGRLGVLLPLERQVAEFGERHLFSRPVTVTAASPYADGDFEAAAEVLKDCDLVVMHCMGFTAEQARRMRISVKAPILISRRIVALNVRQLLMR